MEKWSFNNLLINKLSEVLDLSGAEIARRCGMSQQVMNRYVNNEIVLSVQTLLQICNALRMPLYYFVSEDNNYVLPNRESATIAHDQWHPVGWNHQAVQQIFGNDDGQIAWRHVAAAMGVTPQKPRDRMLLKTRLPIDDFCKACNKLNLSPFTFLIDPNREVKRTSLPRSRNARKSSILPDDAALHQEIAALRQKVVDLDTTVTDLTSKYKILLERHNHLEQTVIRYISHGTPSV